VTGRERLVDAAIAAGAFALTLGLLASGGASSDAAARGLDLLGVVLAAASTLPLLAWRRAPLAVFVATAAGSAVLNAVGYPQGPPFGPTAAVFLLALAPDEVRPRTWVTAATVTSLFAVHAAAAGYSEDGFPTVPLLFGIVVWGGAWVIGDRVRLRRERMAELEARAQRAERDAERERRLAAAEERTRIARDLHDSAGHAINVILVQAGAARLLAEQDPAGARAALATIEDVARETLGEIDQLVRVLRENGRAASGGGIEPPLGLAGLASLVERHHSAGLDVSVAAHGPERPPGPAVDQAAYRILQEALTNAARHGVGSVDVTVEYGADSVELAVSNPARERGPAGAGHGLIGMRERAALLGGTFETVASNGRFSVRARLPYGGGGS
jgi:signal transduction histidine kinase